MECPICKSKQIELVLEKYEMPINQNIVYYTEDTAKECKKGNLKIMICKNCEFIFNSIFDQCLLEYSTSYDNSQIHSKKFATYIDELSEMIINKYKVYDSNIIEIGCGKGYFIKTVAQKTGKGTKIGFDPSYVGDEFLENLNLKFIKRFFSEEFSHLKCDFIICRHVIEHIQNILPFLKNIYSTVKASEGAILFFETPNVNWILENKVTYDFFYEHCSYFNFNSIERAFNESGFDIIEIKECFDRQYMYAVAKIGANKSAYEKKNSNIEIMVKDFIEYISSTEDAWDKKLNQMLHDNKKVALWGAGAKGCSFVNMLKNKKSIDCLIDINKNKQGKFVGGTGHLIISPDEIGKREITDILVMNEIYYDEICNILSKLEIRCDIIGRNI